MCVGKAFRRGSNLVIDFSTVDSSGTGITGLTVELSVYNVATSKYWNLSTGIFDSDVETFTTCTSPTGGGLYYRSFTGLYDQCGNELIVHTKATDLVDGDVYDATDRYLLIQDKINDKLPHSIKKNTAISRFKFVMLDETNGDPTQGFTSILAERRLDDDGGWSVMSGSKADEGYGVYSINIQEDDTNGDTGVWRFTASGAQPTIITFLTEEI